MINCRPFFLCLLLSVLAVDADAKTRDIAELPADRVVTYSQDIAPLLKKNCVACHNASNEEGGVNLESVDRMMNSDADDVLVPGKPDSSRLFLLASHDDDPVMPPEENDVSASAMNPEELALLRRWIMLGAIVDSAGTQTIPLQWSSLPNDLRTIYASAISPGGRLSAVSFGNQIRIFGAGASDPIASLQEIDGQKVSPAHDDFVQDLIVDPSGRRIISAGFRNIKYWELSPFRPVPIPTIDDQEVLAVAMNPSGSHVATFSPRGELSVAEIGKDRWQWLRGFDVPIEFRGDNPPMVRMAVSHDGQSVAVGWDKTLRVVRIDTKEPETIDFTDDLASVHWWASERLVRGDITGKVAVCSRDGNVWSMTEHVVSDKPVEFLCTAQNRKGQNRTGQKKESALVAIDAAGTLSLAKTSQSHFDPIGKLPAPCSSATLAADGDSIWVNSVSGALGKYSLSDAKYVDVTKTDPVSEDRYAQRNWEMLVAEKLVASHDAELKQAEASVTAEEKSLETFQKDIEAKTTLRDEKEGQVTKAKTAAQAATQQLAESKANERAENKKRAEWSESLKQIAASIADLKQQQEKLEDQQANVQTQLAKLPDAKKLAEEVKAAGDAAAKAEKEVESKSSEYSDAVEKLRLAQDTKSRGEARLVGLAQDVKERKEDLQQAKTLQESRKADAETAKTSRDQSLAADRSMAVVSRGTRLLTLSSASNSWSLWSKEGQWLAELSGLSGKHDSSDGDLVAASDNCLLMQGADGRYQALQIPDQIWQHTHSIGSARGQSPFSERVLSMDLDPTGRLLAVGGGQPSRSGELMIFRVSDGSLLQTIDRPHSDTVLCVRFSPDGKTLASSGADRMIKLWDVDSWKLLKTLEGHTHHVTSVAWNVDGRELASGSADATVKIWKVASGKTSRTIAGLKSEITALSYLGRDNRIGFVSGDSYFRVYRTDNGKRETNAKIESNYLYALGSSRDGSRFIVGGADGNAKLIEASGKLVRVYEWSE